MTSLRKHTFGYAISLLLLFSCLLAVPVWAQDDSEEDQKSELLDNDVTTSEDDNAELDSLTVTARRREEALQDVPISVSVFSGEELNALGAQDITYLSQAVPNTTLEISRGTSNTLTAFIRGVGQQDPVAGFEAGVGIYLDDVYLNRPQGVVLDIYDVQQIEVLRGPQGTLYGRNTIGGAVKYITKRLGNEASGKLSTSVGSFGQVDAILSGELPITDNLAVGASFATFNRSGYGDNLTTGKENYNKQIIATRGSIEWTPTSELFVRLSGDYLKDDSNPVGGHRFIPGLLSGAPVLDDVFDTRGGMTGPNNAESYGATLLLEYDINPNWMLKNITAYRADNNIQQVDFDGLPAIDVDVPVIYDNRQSSQELQLLYTSDIVKGLLGFYYLDANAFNVFDVVLGTTGDLIGLPGLNALTLGDVDTKSWSIFTDITFDLGQLFGMDTDLELGVGGRFTSDKRSSTVLRQTMIGGNSTFFGGNAVPIATTSDFAGSERFEDFTPRVTLAWSPVREHNLYGSFSQGFKGGGFDPRGATTATPDFNGDGVVDDSEIFEFMRFLPEKVDTYELGLKSVFAQGRISSNIAVFYSDYSNVQIPGSIGVDGDGDGVAETFAGVTTNAGSADIYGVELDGSAQLGQNLFSQGDALTASWALGWIDADFNEFIALVNDPATGSTALQDVSDQRKFQNTPKWTAQLRLRYDTQMDLFDVPGYFSIIGAWAYRSNTNQFDIPSQFLDQPAYSLFDLNIMWATMDGKYEFSIHGRNLADKEYIASGHIFVTPDGSTSTLGLEGVANGFFGPPRTVTGTFRMNF